MQRVSMKRLEQAVYRINEARGCVVGAGSWRVDEHHTFRRERTVHTYAIREIKDASEKDDRKGALVTPFTTASDLWDWLTGVEAHAERKAVNPLGYLYLVCNRTRDFDWDRDIESVHATLDQADVVARQTPNYSQVDERKREIWQLYPDMTPVLVCEYRREDGVLYLKTATGEREVEAAAS